MPLEVERQPERIMALADPCQGTRKIHGCIVADAPLRVGTGLRFDADVVIHRSANSLFASEVSFRRLHGNVAEQELNLLQFSAR